MAGGLLGKLARASVVFFVFLAVIAFAPNLLDIRPIAHPPAPVIPFEGSLTVNSALNSAEKLFNTHIVGPESFAIRQGQVYTGLHNGWIVRLEEDNEIKFVVSLGDPKCQPWEEERCGRPLGLRFGPKGELFVIDAYKGLMKVDVVRGVAEVVHSRLIPVQGKISQIPNNLDVGSEGDIYWSDSSTRWQLSEGFYEFMEMAGNGRLLHYDPKTNSSKVLVDGLHFANGVQLSPNEEFVLVAETWTRRINKYHLKGPNKGKMEIFADNLPGGPDNIRSNGRGGYWVAICVPQHPHQVKKHNLLSGYPTVRKIFTRIIHLVRQGLRFADTVLDSCFLKNIIYRLAHMLPYATLDRPAGLVLELDSNGKIIRSLHSPDGYVQFISEAEEHDGFLYLGSPWNKYVGKLKLNPLN